MKWRQIPALCLSLGVLLMGLPASAAEKATDFDGFSPDALLGYHLQDDGTASVSCVDAAVTAVSVPETIDGYTVTALEDACFYECTELTSVTLPETLTQIGKEAFFYCDSLTDVHIPAAVTQIGDYAFDSTVELAAFDVAEENTAYKAVDGVLFNEAGTLLIKYPESKADADYTVPDGCTVLEDWAFIGAQYLETVDLNQVQQIGDDAFCYCVSLREAVIPEGVTDLPANLFAQCIKLETVQIPTTVRSIGENCFYSCTSLQNITLPEGLETLGAYALFHCTSLRTLVLPESLVNLSPNCVGYHYDDSIQGVAVNPNCTFYVTKNSTAHRFIKSSGIPFEVQTDFTLWYSVGIVGLCAVIAGLVIAILMVRKKSAKHEERE